MIRPHSLARLAFAALALLLTLPAGCQSPLLADVRASQSAVSPNGDGQDDVAYLHYTVGDSARVSIVLESSGGRYVLHDRLPRTAGSYSFRFDGTYRPDSGRDERRVLADGTYTFRIIAETAGGRQVEQTGTIAIAGADTQPPLIADLTISPDRVSPNGDGDHDDARIGYATTKDAEVSVYVIDDRGGRRVVAASQRQPAALYTVYWNGRVGDTLLPDGRYDVHVRAADRAGNVSEAVAPVWIDGGGRPRLEITRVSFSPKAVPVGGDLTVLIRVKNVGDTAVKTQGPPPGTTYATDTNYMTFAEQRADGKHVPRYYDRRGLWRVGVNWMQADRPYPIRWGLTPDLRPLLPGEEVVITGTIQVRLDETTDLEFWAGVEQGGVGFPGGEKGRQKIRVSY
ncbi:MAG: hypothetical protein HY331_11820 [Chloroflexi bacterium]|nr:hypothetical protein [Chloroflexota bacterium]